METTIKGPGKRPESSKAPGHTDRKDEAAPRHGKDGSGKEDSKDSGKPSEEEVISHWQNPITNQDEQEKITNTGGDDVPVADK